MSELKISTKMTGKMSGFHTLNTSPLDNDFCLKMSKSESTICSKCYSMRALNTYAKSARNAWKDNGEILSGSVLEEMPKTAKEYFRFSSHGEIINENHYVNLVNMAKQNPETRFALWTKRKDIVRKYGKIGADNLTLIYSEPILNNLKITPPKNYDKVFTVFTKEHVEENDININCGGKKCLDCLLCYKENKIVNINEELK